VTPDHETRKFYILNILPTCQSRQFFFSEVFLEVLILVDNHFFAKILSLEKM
jgi:hypothetical protein